jgi:hypothetical protein
MAANPTKILAYDLDPELGSLIAQLTEFQGSYTTLLERLTSLTPDTFDDNTQAVIEDLLGGFENGGIHMVQRVANMRSELEAISPVLDAMRAELDVIGPEIDNMRTELAYDTGTYGEKFTYDPTYGNVTKHETTGDKTVTVVYNYADMAAGKLSTSVQTFQNKAGDAIKITKTYTYDANENITNIATSTEITPAEPAV